MGGVSFILLPLFLLITFAILYRNGFLVLSSKRALSFIGIRRGREASFTACTGHIRWVVRFPDSKTVRVSFAPQLTKGSISLEIRDHDAQLLFLDSTDTTGSFSAAKGRSYTVIIHFHSASGKYTLSLD